MISRDSYTEHTYTISQFVVAREPEHTPEPPGIHWKNNGMPQQIIHIGPCANYLARHVSEGFNNFANYHPPPYFSPSVSLFRYMGFSVRETLRLQFRIGPRWCDV